MKLLAVLVVFIVLFNEIEPRPRTDTGTVRRYSSIRPTNQYYNSNANYRVSINDSPDNSDGDSYSWSFSNECPTISNIIDSSIRSICINGKRYVNGQEIKNVKSTDRIEIISNDLRINGKFIRHIPPSGSNDSNVSSITGGNIGRGNGCPPVTKIGCINISNYCMDGQLYINGERIRNVKSTDRVEIISNILKINGKFISKIPPSGNSGNFRSDSDSDDEKLSESEGLSDNDESDEDFIDEGGVEEEDEDSNVGETDDDEGEDYSEEENNEGDEEHEEWEDEDVQEEEEGEAEDLEADEEGEDEEGEDVDEDEEGEDEPEDCEVDEEGEDEDEAEDGNREDEDELEDWEVDEEGEDADEEGEDEDEEGEDEAEDWEVEDEDTDDDDNEDGEENDEDDNEEYDDGGDDDEEYSGDEEELEEKGSEDENDDDFYYEEKIAPKINVNYSDNVFTRTENGKFFVNDFELKNYKSTDRILVDHNNLYVNGKFIRYVKPYEW